MRLDTMRTFGLFLVAVVAIGMLTGCFTKPLPPPAVVLAPEPIMDNSGRYMSPYTQDGVLAEWVDKAIKVKLGKTIGGIAGAEIGKRALGSVPFIGGLLGSTAGEAIGREVAIQAAGGWDFIKSTSDLSFNSIDDMAVYLYAKHSAHEHYNNALKATWEIYTELQTRYIPAIHKAPQRSGSPSEEPVAPQVQVTSEAESKAASEVASEAESKAPSEVQSETKPSAPSEVTPEKQSDEPGATGPDTEGRE
jgi:hypothetical protein